MQSKLKIGEKAKIAMPIEIKAIDKENFTLTMVASTQGVDRQGDTIIQAGWDLKPFLKNPVILNSHNYSDVTEVIAKATRTEIVGTGKRAKLEQDWKFAVAENPKAETAWKLYAGGYLHASSVGLIPKKFAENPDGSRNWFVIEEAELLEVSAVSVPANSAALMAKGIGVDIDQLREAINIDEDTETAAEDENTPEDPQPAEETVVEKIARLKAERERIETELKAFEEAPAVSPVTTTTVVTATSKAVIIQRTIHQISNERTRALVSAQKEIERLLKGNQTVPTTLKNKVDDRIYHKIIRELIRAK